MFVCLRLKRPECVTLSFYACAKGGGGNGHGVIIRMSSAQRDETRWKTLFDFRNVGMSVQPFIFVFVFKEAWDALCVCFGKARRGG